MKLKIQLSKSSSTFDQWTETILARLVAIVVAAVSYFDTPNKNISGPLYLIDGYICLSFLILIQAYEAIFLEKVTHEVQQK